MPQADFYIGLPVIANSFTGFSNNSFTYRDLVQQKIGTDSIFLNFNDYLASLKQDNFIYAGATTDLVSIGWREGRWYVGARVTEVADFRIRFGKDLMNIAINGNAPYAGITQNLGKLFVQSSHYRKYAINLSRDFNCKFRAGVNLGYLYGMENLDVQRSNITLLTDPVTFDLSGQSDILINTSGIDEFSTDSVRSWSYLFQRPNRGYSIDLGATYFLNDRIQFSGSILDIGRIRWNFRPVNYQNRVNEFSFSGISLNQFLSNSVDSIQSGVEKYLDSLGNIFNINESSNSYTTRLPSRIYLSGSYELSGNNTFRLTYLGNTFRGSVYSSAALAYTKNFNDILEFTVQWALHNNTVSNLGAGFTLNLGLTQFSILADNVPALFGSYKSRGTTVRAGITLVTSYDEGRPDFCDKDKDGVPNNRDECPSDPGPIALMGCPDTDSDGIADKFDECPLEFGLVGLRGCPDKDGDGIKDKDDLCPELKGSIENSGCPDSDNDGIIDKNDDCPDIAGLKWLKGCPDRDGDSIPDKEDLCPDLFGLEIYSGCPDTDEDGIPDNSDECPQTAGLKEFKGCPDTDGDGLSDQNDRCPELFGEKSNMGCPSEDRDGDGIPDKTDKCPETPGTKENQGCPEISESEQDVLKTAFENLEFETGKAVITASSYEALDELINLLKRKDDWGLKISGHTDNTGNASKNMQLSRNRAKAVALYIVSGGVTAGRLEVEWFGQNKPVADNTSSVGRKKNRRVEMKVIFN
ncbi:MAG: DUF5723 family protein [Bacteroidia bacterium]